MRKESASGGRPLILVLGVNPVSTKPTKFERLGATAILLLVWQIGYIPMAVVPQFADVFEGFGDEAVPASTEFAMRFPEIFLLIPTVCSIAYLLYWFNVPLSVRVQVGCVVASLLVIPLAVVLMYLPILELGTVVND